MGNLYRGTGSAWPPAHARHAESKRCGVLAHVPNPIASANACRIADTDSVRYEWMDDQIRVEVAGDRGYVYDLVDASGFDYI